jgi:hypothetical protein
MDQKILKEALKLAKAGSKIVLTVFICGSTSGLIQRIWR